MVKPTLEEVFPGLRGQSYRITSPADHRYNCIAFAAGDDHKSWWPDLAEDVVPSCEAKSHGDTRPQAGRPARGPGRVQPGRDHRARHADQRTLAKLARCP